MPTAAVLVRKLTQAHNWLKDKQHWHPEYMGTTKDGTYLHDRMQIKKYATRTCSLGACMKYASSDNEAHLMMTALNETAIALYNRGLTHVNTYVGHRAVLRLFKHTISRLDRV